jgi:hypothetical protein
MQTGVSCADILTLALTISLTLRLEGFGKR